MRNVLNGEDIVMKSAGSQLRSYIYIADCASAILTVLLNGKSGEAYNTANPNARVTIAQLAEIIAKAGGRKVIFATPSAVDIANRTPIAKQVLSSKKIEALGWSGAFSAETGIRHTLDILQGE
jgi:nucleoside-diphosphate-sugar epimerase